MVLIDYVGSLANSAGPILLVFARLLSGSPGAGWKCVCLAGEMGCRFAIEQHAHTGTSAEGERSNELIDGFFVTCNSDLN